MPNHSEARDEAETARAFDSAKDGHPLTYCQLPWGDSKKAPLSPREEAMGWALRCYGEMEVAS